jgi:hypothetical protein
MTRAMLDITSAALGMGHRAGKTTLTDRSLHITIILTESLENLEKSSCPSAMRPWIDI